LQQLTTLVVEFLVKYSFQIIGAIIILLVGIRLAGWLGRSVSKFCEKHNIDITLSRFLGNFIKVLVITFVIIIAIGKFGISIAPFIAALGALAFGSSFAIQGPLSNYGAGISIILTQPFKVGNTISVKGVSGVVEEIHLAATVLTTEDNEVITIPNKHIVGEILLNSFANKIVETTVGISYDDDPDKAISVLKEVLAEILEISLEPPPQIGIAEFADSAINISLRYWVPTKKYFQIQYQVNQKIHRALIEAGIHIPFPQRDVHLVNKIV
ncbi:MAG: mechanosensitive ion channel protein MscS, partial [Thermoplasmata archaeon M8B2D]